MYIVLQVLKPLYETLLTKCVLNSDTPDIKKVSYAESEEAPSN